LKPGSHKTHGAQRSAPHLKVQVQTHLHDLLKFFKRYWARASFADGIDKGINPRLMTFVLAPQVHLLESGPTEGVKFKGYCIGLRIRKRMEEVFGWLKTIGCLVKLHHRRRKRVDAVYTTLATALPAYNLLRI